jgi:hypothetical protein
MHFTKVKPAGSIFYVNKNDVHRAVFNQYSGTTRNEAHMKTLASQIERELQADEWKHCAVYEHDLIRLWPLDEPKREAKIAQFAEEYGFRLRFYRQGLCAIFEKRPRGRS